MIQICYRILFLVVIVIFLFYKWFSIDLLFYHLIDLLFYHLMKFSIDFQFPSYAIT